MTGGLDERLRDPGERAGKPPSLQARIAARVREEPQSPDSEGFELRRIGPVVALVLVLAAVAPLLSPRRPAVKPDASGDRLSVLLGEELEQCASRAEEPYRSELAGIRADASRLFDVAASGLRRAGGLE